LPAVVSGAHAEAAATGDLPVGAGRHGGDRFGESRGGGAGEEVAGAGDDSEDGAGDRFGQPAGGGGGDQAVAVAGQHGGGDPDRLEAGEHRRELADQGLLLGHEAVEDGGAEAVVGEVVDVGR